MALLMLNTLKTTRLLNVFLTENYTKTWNVKWCPLTTVWIEIQHHSRSKAGDFTPASCGTHRLHGKGWCVEPGPEPASLGAEPPPGVPAESTWLHSTARRKGHIPLSCLPLKARPHQRSCTEVTNLQYPCVLWSALTRSCQEKRTDRKTTDNPSNPDKEMETCKNKIRSHKEDRLAKM